MTTTPNPSEPFSPFLPTTENVPKDQEDLNYFLGDRFARISDVVNDKVIGGYTEAESQNGKKFGYINPKITRNGYQTMLRIDSFVTGSFDLPMSILDDDFEMTLVYGTASTFGDYFSFMSQGDARIQFTVNATQVNITAMAPMAAYAGFIFFEYIRNAKQE